MNFEKVAKEVKGQFETVAERSQGVAKVSVKAIKAANEVVIEGVQDLAQTQAEAAKDLYTASKNSFEKAVNAGLVAVVKNPINYLPDGRETIVDAFNETIETVTKTGEKLAKVAKTGYAGITAEITGKPVRAQAKKAHRKVRKAAAEVAQTAAA